MKLHNLLLTAAIFLTAGIASAKTYEELSWPNTSDSINVVMLVQNSSWSNFSVGAYNATGTLLDSVALSNPVNLTQEQVTALLDETDLDDTMKANIQKFNASHLAYQFAVSLDDFSGITSEETVASFGLIGSNGGNDHLAYSYTGTGVQGNEEHFTSLGDDNVLFFGKEKWIGKFNNGDIFLVGLSDGTVGPGGGAVFGSPLPAPVVTLLIALGFGAALVMYRNRKAKA